MKIFAPLAPLPLSADEPISAEHLGELADELRVCGTDSSVLIDVRFLTSMVRELRHRRLYELSDNEARLVGSAVVRALHQFELIDADREALSVALDKLREGM